MSRTTSRVSRGTVPEEGEVQAPQQSPHPLQTAPSGVPPPFAKVQSESNLLQPLVMQFSVVLQVSLILFLFQKILFLFIG